MGFELRLVADLAGEVGGGGVVNGFLFQRFEWEPAPKNAIFRSKPSKLVTK